MAISLFLFKIANICIDYVCGAYLSIAQLCNTNMNKTEKNVEADSEFFY